jgi:GIY-YIG catalytic domain
MQPADLTALNSVLKEAKTFVKTLVDAPHCAISDIPTSQGVYLIYDKGGNVMYVGKGINLNRRIWADHCGGDKNMSTSTFRRSVNRVHGIAAGRLLLDWVRNTCEFAFVAIPEPDLCSAVEALTIQLLRRRGRKLLKH